MSPGRNVPRSSKSSPMRMGPGILPRVGSVIRALTARRELLEARLQLVMQRRVALALAHRHLGRIGRVVAEVPRGECGLLVLRAFDRRARAGVIADPDQLVEPTVDVALALATERA